MLIAVRAWESVEAWLAALALAAILAVLGIVFGVIPLLIGAIATFALILICGSKFQSTLLLRS
jgi:hypothetical protein